MKKRNADALEDKSKPPQDHASMKRDQITGRAEFPRYDTDYEIMPGVTPIKKK